MARPRARLTRRDLGLGLLTVALMVGIVLTIGFGHGNTESLEVSSCVSRGIDFYKGGDDWPTLNGRPTEDVIRARCQASPSAF